MARQAETPIFVRDATILPLARLDPTSSAFHGEHVAWSPVLTGHGDLSGSGTPSTRYEFDDGMTFAFTKGRHSIVKITAERTKDQLAVTSKVRRDKAGLGKFTFTAQTELREVTINGKKAQSSPAQGIAIGNGKMKTWCTP
jgi:hypothetical protein